MYLKVENSERIPRFVVGNKKRNIQELILIKKSLLNKCLYIVMFVA